MAARTGRPYKLQVLSTNGERKLQGSANNPTEAALHKCNTRIESVYHLHETLHEAQMQGTNKCLRVMEHMLSEFNNLVTALNQGRHPAHPTTRPQTPLPPIPPVPSSNTRIHRPSAPVPASAPAPVAPPPVIPLVVITGPNQTPSAPAPTRTRLPRKSAEGPKNYVDKPLTPSPQSSPDPLNPPTVAGPSRTAPSYASAAATGGSFQPVINRRNRNHRNRTTGAPRAPPTSSPPNNKASQLIVIRHDHETPLTPSLCMSVVNAIRARLRPTTCPGSISEVKSSARGNLVLTTDRSVLAQDLWPFRKHIILGLNDCRIGPFDLTLNQSRLPLYISNVPLSYPRGGANRSWHPDDWDTAALERLKADVSSSNAVEAVDRPFAIGTFVGMKSRNQDHCAFVVNLIRNPASEELARTELAAVAGRRVFCREWFPDAHRSYCSRCLSPGHHHMMCRNRHRCKFCHFHHPSDRHRCSTCDSQGFCPSHDQKVCYNCNSFSHFAGDEKCPDRTVHRSIDTENPGQVLHDPTTSGKHTGRPHPSRRGLPLPLANPPPPRPTSPVISISSDDLDAAIDALPESRLRDFDIALNSAIDQSERLGQEIVIPVPDEDTDSTDYTDTHWRACECALDDMSRTPCPATRDLAYDITHDHPYCRCTATDKNLRCRFFERFIDGSTPPGSPPADPELGAILANSSEELSKKHNRTISITTSGRILVEGLDPDTPEYAEWIHNETYRPHGPTCHCKSSPAQNLRRAACPNHFLDTCPCYHLPGPLAGIIEVAGSPRINVRTAKSTDSRNRITKPARNTRAQTVPST